MRSANLCRSARVQPHQADREDHGRDDATTQMSVSSQHRADSRIGALSGYDRFPGRYAPASRDVDLGQLRGAVVGGRAPSDDLFVAPAAAIQNRRAAAERLPAQDDHVDVLRIELDQPRLASRLLAYDQGRARAAERVQHDVPGLARVADRPLDQRHRLHGRMKIVPGWLVEEPDVTLIPGPAPVVVGTVLPAVQDRLVLALVVGAPKREGVLRPDDERRPPTAGGPESPLQRVQLRAAHADIAG